MNRTERGREIERKGNLKSVFEGERKSDRERVREREDDRGKKTIQSPTFKVLSLFFWLSIQFIL